MDILLYPHQAYTATYLDDVVVHLSTWQDHLFPLGRVLEDLWRAGLTMSPWKCHLGLTEAQYLGYSMGQGLLKMQEKKMEVVKHYPQLETKKQVQAIL